MIKLLIDIGNTSAKMIVSDGIKFLHYERLNTSWEEAFDRLMGQFCIERCAISTVAKKDEDLIAVLEKYPFEVIWLKYDTPCPVKQICNVPEGYGVDRLAADMGAIAQDRVNTLLVIDAGTCITYDLIDKDGALKGGVISPGVQLRLKAMHEHTALLPLFEAEETAPIMGMDTKSCMMSSALNGVQFEIEGYIRRLIEDYPDLHIFITGGNKFVFQEDIEKRVTHDPYLVFKGLNLL